jgi:hypothetical protein
MGGTPAWEIYNRLTDLGGLWCKRKDMHLICDNKVDQSLWSLWRSGVNITETEVTNEHV